MSLLLDALKRAERKQAEPREVAPRFDPVLQETETLAYLPLAVAAEQLAAAPTLPPREAAMLGGARDQGGDPLDLPEIVPPPRTPPRSEPEPLAATSASVAPELRLEPAVPPPVREIAPAVPDVPADAAASTPGGRDEAEHQRQTAAARAHARQILEAPHLANVSTSKRLVWLSLLVLVTAAGVGGGLWWLSGGMAARDGLIPPPPAVDPGPPLVDTGPAGFSPVAAEAPATAVPQAVVPTGTGQKQAGMARREAAARPRAAEQAGPAPATRQASGKAIEAPGKGGEAAIQVARGTRLSVGERANQAAAGALAGGRPEEARRHYAEALAADPRDREALLGLASLAVAGGREAEAAALYERVLALDPRDPEAVAGLALLRGPLDPVAFESRLKSLLAHVPEHPAPHYALGALLARQHRWGEAEAAYYRAVALAPDNPDYQYNLAVSLDHLKQSGPARAAYRKALELAKARPAGFSREAVERRLAELGGAPG